MKAVVFDASVLLKLFIAEEHSETAVELFTEHEAHAPDWWRMECVSGAWKHFNRGEMSVVEAATRFEGIRRLDVVDHSFVDLAPPASALALELVHPVYDCLYVALALAECMSLVTSDRRQAAAARDVGVQVLFIGD